MRKRDTACLLILATALSGCATPSRSAVRLAERMLDPATPERRRLEVCRELRSLTPESEPYLADAFFPVGLYDVPETAFQEIAAALCPENMGRCLVVTAGRIAAETVQLDAVGVFVDDGLVVELVAHVADVRRRAHGAGNARRTR